MSYYISDTMSISSDPYIPDIILLLFGNGLEANYD